MEYREQPRHYYEFGFSRRFSPGVKWIIIVTVGFYLLELIISSASEGMFWTVFGRLGLTPSDVFGRGFIWQLVTYAFLHDPRGLMHILFNMLFLYWFGREVEQVWGTKRFVLFYLTAAVFSGFVFSAVHIFLPVSWCIGASGAIMAVVMVYALWWPNRMILVMLFFPMRVRTFVIIVIIAEMVSFLQMRGGVANMAHLGGLLYGYLVIRHGRRLTPILTRVQRLEYEDPDRDRRRMDELLDKVHRQGIRSLSWRERRFLKKMSRRP